MILNVEAITSQKIAVGLVENPACWRLRDLAAEVPADQAVVELGAFKGRTTGWLVMGAQSSNGARVVSVDPWDSQDALPEDYLALAPAHREYRLSETRAAYEQHLDETGIRPFVTSVGATAVEAAKSYDGPPVGLLWSDALHRRSDVREDTKAWLPHMAEQSVIVLHDAGDPRFGVEAGARDALTRTKAAREKWDWAGREVQLWPKQPTRRGILIVRTR